MTELCFKNYYYCPDCDYRWEDVWAHTCDDRCPICNTSYKPYESDDLEPSKQVCEHCGELFDYNPNDFQFYKDQVLCKKCNDREVEDW